MIVIAIAVTVILIVINSYVIIKGNDNITMTKKMLSIKMKNITKHIEK